MINRQDFFNMVAATWDERFQTQELLIFLEQLVPTFHLKSGQTILDAGTGTGVLIPFLLKAVGSTGHVVAIDYAEKMIEICKAKFAHFPNVSVAVQSVENLQFPSESFDVITCFGLFPHIENKEIALRQMNRVLKPKGTLIIAHALSSMQIKTHHHNTSPAVAHDALPEQAEMRQLLRQTGFKDIRIIDEPGRYLCLANKPATEFV